MSREALSVVLDDEACELSPDEMAEALQEQLSGLDEAGQQGFQQALATLGRTAAVAAPGVTRGAAAGAAAGPFGAFIGGLAGGASAALSARSAPPPAPRQSPSGPNVPAAELLRLLQDRRVLQATASLVPGEMGRRAVPIGGADIPPAAVLNLLAVLALQAAAQAPVTPDAEDDYLLGADGEAACDLADPGARAEVLLERFKREPDPAPAEASPEEWLVECGLAERVMA